MSLPINNLAVQAVETIFSLTNEISHPLTIKISEDSAGGGYTYDPITGTYSEAAEAKADLVVADTRILKFKDKEIRDSNGAITPNSRKVYFRFADLNGESITNADTAVLPNGQTVQINSLKFLPDEFNPVFVVLVVEGVNQP